MSREPSPDSGWHVYMLRCADGSLYTGIAKDLLRRLAEHNGDDRLAARYTLGRRPVELVYSEAAPCRAAAARRERLLKRLSRRAKESMIGEAEAGAAGARREGRSGAAEL
jgi:putative endonuclease